jgi:hypothetical protein
MPPDVDEGDGGNRRRLMLIGGVAAVVIIAVAAYMLLHKSSSPTGTFTPPKSPATAGHTGGASHGTTKSGSTKAGKVIPKKSRTTLVRDPFKPLVVAPQSAAAGTSTGSNPVSTTTVPQQSTTGTGGSTTPVIIPTTPSGGGQPTGGTHGQTTSGSPLWIQLVSTQGTHAAVFDVGYAHHKFRRFKVIAPSPSSSRGTVFDGEFALLGIQGGEVTIQVGDDTPFDLTRGVAHTV